MGNKFSRVAVSDAGKEEQQGMQFAIDTASIADVSKGPSSKSSPVVEQLELSEISDDAAPLFASASATSPPTPDPFTSVGTPGDLALLPSLVEVSHQIVYNNNMPSTTAPSRRSTHDRIVELFAGMRPSSVAQAHRKTRSEEVLKRPEPSAGRSAMTRNQPPSLIAQNFMAASVVRGMEHGVVESVVLESFTPPKEFQDRQLVVHPNLDSHDHGTHQAQAHISSLDQDLGEVEHDIFDIQRPVAELSPVRPVGQRSLPVAIALTRIPVPRQSKQIQDHVREFSFKKRLVKPVLLEETPASLNGLYPGMPVDLHEGMPAYYEWLKEHGYVDENYAVLSVRRPAQHPVRLPVQHSMHFEPPASVKPVHILPAPVHELNGFAAVAKDEFKPQNVIRGFETPYSTSHPDKPKPRTKVEIDKLFAVPLEYSREHNCAVQNRAACGIPPLRSTLSWLNGADDSNSDSD
jgi:hypothetical protein